MSERTTKGPIGPTGAPRESEGLPEWMERYAVGRVGSDARKLQDAASRIRELERALKISGRLSHATAEELLSAEERIRQLERELADARAALEGLIEVAAWANGIPYEQWRDAVSAARRALAASPERTTNGPSGPTEDDEVMVCGHTGYYWSSEWKRCTACEREQGSD